MNSLEKKIDTLSAEMKAGFKMIDVRLDGHGVRLAGHDTRHDGHDAQFIELRQEIDDLARMTAEEFAAVRTEMATKADLEALREELNGDMQALRTDMRGDMEVLFDRYMGILRKDTDSLAMRVKRLETRVFPA